MSVMGYSKQCFTLLGVVFFAAGAAYANTIEVDIAQKSAKCDSDMFLAKVMSTGPNQVFLHVFNNTPDPQKIIVKINGLKPGQQDLYVNGDYIGKKPAAAFESGYQFDISGRMVHPVLLRCVESTKDRVEAEMLKLKGKEDGEYFEVGNTIGQAVGWINACAAYDKRARSIDIIVAPADAVLQTKASAIWRDPTGTNKEYLGACHLLQKARNRMYLSIKKDKQLCNEAVASMTPVDVKLTYYVANGKPKGLVTIVNNCDLSISGQVSPIAPAGWKAEVKKPGFSDLKSGSSCKVDFALVPVKPGSAVPESIKSHTVIDIGFDTLWAKVNYDLEAKQGQTAVSFTPPAPSPEKTGAENAPTVPGSVPAAPVVPALPGGN